MKLKEPENNNPESTYNHLVALREQFGLAILKREWARRREEIIAEGKKTRADNKQVQVWAKIDGYDEARMLLDFLIDKYGEIVDMRKTEQEQESESQL